jgi:hypothetical protein
VTEQIVKMNSNEQNFPLKPLQADQNANIKNFILKVHKKRSTRKEENKKEEVDILWQMLED